jgi:hypothetical protein
MSVVVGLSQNRYPQPTAPLTQGSPMPGRYLSGESALCVQRGQVSNLVVNPICAFASASVVT